MLQCYDIEFTKFDRKLVYFNILGRQSEELN